MTIMTIMTIKRDTVETTFAILAMFLQQKVLSQSRCTLAQEETVRRIMSSSAATSYSSPPTGAESGLSSSYEYIFIRSSQLCGLSNMDCIHGHGHVTVVRGHWPWPCHLQYEYFGKLLERIQLDECIERYCGSIVGSLPTSSPRGANSSSVKRKGGEKVNTNQKSLNRHRPDCFEMRKHL